MCHVGVGWVGHEGVGWGRVDGWVMKGWGGVGCVIGVGHEGVG